MSDMIGKLRAKQVGRERIGCILIAAFAFFTHYLVPVNLNESFALPVMRVGRRARSLVHNSILVAIRTKVDKYLKLNMWLAAWLLRKQPEENTLEQMDMRRRTVALDHRKVAQDRKRKKRNTSPWAALYRALPVYKQVLANKQVLRKLEACTVQAYRVRAHRLGENMKVDMKLAARHRMVFRIPLMELRSWTLAGHRPWAENCKWLWAFRSLLKVRHTSPWVSV